MFSGPNRTESIEALSPEAQLIYLVQVLDGEVINGGFHQYFSNSAGGHTHQTQRALLEVGAVGAARLLERAVRAFPDGRVSIDRAARTEQLDVVDERRPGFFDALSTEYYALTDTDAVKEDLTELMLSFMREHLDAPVAAT